MEEINLRPVGIVRCEAKVSQDLPREGVRARIQILDEYASCLKGIEANSHLIVIGWLHEADRSAQLVRPRSLPESFEPIGVFATRSPARPNPISVTVCRLLSVTEKVLEVEDLDLVDGTPVIDIKPYLSSGDCHFKARDGIYLARLSALSEGDRRELFLSEASRYHGERCENIKLSAIAASEAYKVFGDLRNEGLQLVCNCHPCIADGLVGILKATFLGGRLTSGTDVGRIEFIFQGKSMVFYLRDRSLVDKVDLYKDAQEYFSIEVRPPWLASA